MASLEFTHLDPKCAVNRTVQRKHVQLYTDTNLHRADICATLTKIRKGCSVDFIANPNHDRFNTALAAIALSMLHGFYLQATIPAAVTRHPQKHTPTMAI